MVFIGAGIDTIRFKVRAVGFDSWLKKQGLKLVAYRDNSFSSRNLNSKVSSGKYSYVGVVHFGRGNQSLVESLVVTRSKELMRQGRSRTYIVEVAGLHQPQRDNITGATYRMLSKLLHKYDIFQVDLAFDFESLEPITKGMVCDVLSLKSSKVRAYGYPYPTFYTSGRGNKDVVIYNKSSKSGSIDGYGSSCGWHWHRLEIALQFKKLSTSHIKELSTSKVIERNRVFLSYILQQQASNRFALEIMQGLQVLSNKPKSIDTSFIEMQVAKILNLRLPLPIYEV